MSARPGRIAAIFDIDIPRPRSVEIQTRPEFIARVLRVKASIDKGASQTAGLAIA
jgi:NitT/TauT family transport system ATP-binding protein